MNTVDFNGSDELGQNGLCGAARVTRSEKPIEAGHVDGDLSTHWTTECFKERPTPLDPTESQVVEKLSRVDLRESVNLLIK
jgi:hypothetical protein